MRITTYRFIMAAMAALAAGALAVSCSKEPVVGDNGDGPRTISVSFGEGTKTVLGEKQTDGIFPARFTASDVILVSNGSALEDCKVIIGSDGGASITTTLKGDLKAVYPPEAAVYLGYNITGFKVSDSQSGRFEDAHICTATIPEGNTEAHFKNETAILKFYVDASIGVTSIKVTSAGADIATGSKTITVTAPRGKTLADVTDDTKKRICYVSVLPGVNANQLTYETVTTTQPTLPRTPTDDVELTASVLYKAFIPYYIDMGAAGKWGYCNVGAFLPEDYGRYFIWGETTGIVPNSDNTFTFPDEKYFTAENHTWDKTKGFSFANSPWTDGVFVDSSTKNVFTKYTTSNVYAKSGNADMKTRLDPADDAACANWGENWCMPTIGAYATADITKLVDACCPGGYSSGTISNPPTTTKVPMSQGIYFYDVAGSTGEEGFYFVDEAGNKLFFPDAGFGNGTDHILGSGNYWGSTFGTDDGKDFLGCSINFDSSGVKPQNCSKRMYGFTIRPILNDAWWYEDLDDGGTI